jgi:putative serine protease PepD
MTSPKLRTPIRVIAGFIAGAAVAGTVATAATNTAASAIFACADNRTQVLYLSKTGTCTSTRTLVELGGSQLNAKSISALVTPSVVSIAVSALTGDGNGSGSIYRSNGSMSYIITNNHVVEAAAASGTISVELTSGEEISAKIVGRDRMYDLAVLSVQKGNLPAIVLGDSSKVSVGDPVLAIGSPLGFASTVTSGIISALNRPVSAGEIGAESYVNAIQTDAAINPGNSGGALIDAQGRIIGINSVIATLSSDSTSGSIGLGFSIPINEAKRVIDEIISTGKSTRPVLGVFFSNAFTGVGAKIDSVVPGEAADQAGIPAGAVIRSIDGAKIVNRDSAIVKIRSYPPKSLISILCDLPTGGSKTFKVTLGVAASVL